jgi:hypothetical protein
VRGRIIIGAGALCAAAWLTTGCSGQARTQDVRSAADSFLTALSNSDWTSACDALLPKTREQLESMTGSDCSEALQSLNLQPAQTDAVEIWGDQALARTNGDALFLTELDDGWRIRAAGCQTRGEQPAECELEG